MKLLRCKGLRRLRSPGQALLLYLHVGRQQSLDPVHFGLELTALPPIVQVVSLRLLLTVVPLGVALRRRADLALGRLPVDGAVFQRAGGAWIALLDLGKSACG